MMPKEPDPTVTVPMSKIDIELGQAYRRALEETDRYFRLAQRPPRDIAERRRKKRAQQKASRKRNQK